MSSQPSDSSPTSWDSDQDRPWGFFLCSLAAAQVDTCVPSRRSHVYKFGCPAGARKGSWEKLDCRFYVRRRAIGDDGDVGSGGGERLRLGVDAGGRQGVRARPAGVPGEHAGPVGGDRRADAQLAERGGSVGALPVPAARPGVNRRRNGGDAGLLDRRRRGRRRGSRRRGDVDVAQRRKGARRRRGEEARRTVDRGGAQVVPGRAGEVRER